MKTYLVTGAGRGVGRALAEALLRRGERVIGAVRSDALPTSSPAYRALRFDVRDAAAIDAAAAAVDEPIDVLINNAGVMGPRDETALGVDLDAFAEVLAVNVLGPLRVLNAFLPHLRRAEGAKVVFVSSQLGGSTFPGSGRVAYRTSKAALNRAAQCVAEDLAREGIATLIAHPGWVRTDMGGPDAEIAPAESAAGLLGVIDALTLATTGRFVDWNGAPRPW